MTRSLVVILSLVGWLLPIRAQQGAWRKMSPMVRLAAVDAQQGGATRGTASDRRTITAFIRLEPGASDLLLLRYGCRKHAQWGDIAICEIPLSALGALSAEPSVRRIEASRPASLQMDTTAAVVNALPVYEATASHQAFTGQGVVVGLVDVGFDLTHPTLYDRQLSRYRVGAFWDQLSRDTVGSRLPVGRDFVGPEAILSAVASTDSATHTHGTHTSGIAAGSGYDTPYRGIAYDSDLCLVANAVSSNIEYVDSARLYDYTTATDALGFKYCLDYAESLGRPCVVSMSEGYAPYLDQEDSLYAAVLDSLSGPGRIIVASAGNGGIEKAYCEKPAGGAETGAFVNCLHDAALYRIMADGPVRLTLYYYGETGAAPTDTLAFETAEVPLDTILTRKLMLGEDSLELMAYRDRPRFDTEDIWQLMIKGSRPLNQLMPMALTMAGQGRAEAYGSSTYALRDHEADSRWTAARRGRDVLAPGCFPAVITVGSTAHRLNILNTKGENVDTDYSGAVAGAVWQYSSTGPSMNGLVKPDVVAPGTNVVSAYSHIYHPEKHVVASSEIDGILYHWGADSGTSMSAPVVAGVIALWLQANPGLTPDDIRGVLGRTCRQPEAGISYPNATYGYGEIDAYRGLLDVLGLTAIEGISRHEPSGVAVTPVDGGVQLCFGEQPRDPIYIKVYSISGACVGSQSVCVDDLEAVVPLPSALKGIHVVQLTSANARLCGSTLLNLQ